MSMRIPTSQFPSTLTSQLQTILNQELTYQKQSATGLRITKSSDDPVDYQRALVRKNQLASNEAYLSTVESATTLVTYNHQAMSDLQTALTKASEIATKVNSTYSDSDLQAMASEIDGIITQVAQIANRQKDGVYLFGGTSNAQPVTVDTSTTPTTYTFNAATNGTVTTAQIASGTGAIDTGIVAGRSSGTSYDGFLYDSSSGVDVLNTLIQLRDHLNNGTADVTAVQGMLDQVNSTVDLASEYVGKTAAKLESLSLAQTTLENQIQTDKTALSDVVGANMAEAVTNLQQLQTNYEAALSSGAKILQMSILNYLP